MDPLGVGEPFEPELAEISRRHVLERADRVGGHEDLAPVTGVRDARGADDVDARVPLVAEHRRAGVQSRPGRARESRPAIRCPAAGAGSRAPRRLRREPRRTPRRIRPRRRPTPRRRWPRPSRAACGGGARSRPGRSRAAPPCRAVEPSTSAKRNVTVPVGSAFTGRSVFRLSPRPAGSPRGSPCLRRAG